jgi:L-alanine-DL-glutamate epimerase-like enolase superfamily enzyme
LEEFPLSRIIEITARALSSPTPGGITFAVGRSAKRDMVLVKVVTDEGTVGWGEAHHAQAPSTIAAFVNDALGPSLIGQDPHAIEVLWDRVYQRFISTHGPGAAAVIGLSGVDLALWDIKGKELGQPVWRLLGGQKRRVPAYAGGISLGFQPVDELAREIEALMEQGYRMVKAPVSTAGIWPASSRSARRVG